MLINVIGLGYIGLPTSLILASSGNKVVGTDINTDIVSSLKSGKITFRENGLEKLFEEAVNNNILFTDKYVPADVYIVTVPTPYMDEEKTLDNSYLISAVNEIIDVIDRDIILIIESTVAPGTISEVIRPLLNKSSYRVSLAHAPERILPGNMIEELKTNSRTLGVDNDDVGEKVKTIYESFTEGEIIVTDIETAEMSKVIENTYRDINIAFANEVSSICKSAGLDVMEVIKIANKHPRVKILSPGPGVGGHCIPVDPWFLISKYKKQTNLISMARKINEDRPGQIAEKIHQIASKYKIEEQSIGIYGLSYKENVDDVRESPTVQLLEQLQKYGINNIKVYDPYVLSKVCEQQTFDKDEFFAKTKLFVIMLYHDVLELDTIGKHKIVVDTKYKINKNEYNFKTIII